MLRPEQTLETLPDGIRVSGKVPEDLEVFQDHFPDFAVVPGVLALDLLRQAADMFYRNERGGEAPGGVIVRAVKAVKFSSYLRPGDRWEAEMKRIKQEGPVSRWKGRIYLAGRDAVSAQLSLELELA